MTDAAHNETLTSVLQLLEQALGMIDQSDAPAHIGAHLDLALCQLREHLEDNSAQQAWSCQSPVGRC